MCSVVSIRITTIYLLVFAHKTHILILVMTKAHKKAEKLKPLRVYEAEKEKDNQTAKKKNTEALQCTQ